MESKYKVIAMSDENEKEQVKALTAKKKDNFSEWYTQILINSEFIDYSAVSGVIVFRPSSYYVWDKIREATDVLFKEAGIKDAYFPLFIPERFLNKEKEHIAGFNPEVAWVTGAGNSTFDERLAVRPTSETIMYDSYSRWIKSWRDLPLRLNQWNNVVRWEFKHPTPFIRSREFLWNEGHTAFATEKEALEEREQVLGIYSKVLKEVLALEGVPGKKTNKEKFAGAIASYSIEMLMPDGWAIQGPDFHNDGQNFSKSFDIKFTDKNGNYQYVHQNTFAISTRMIGIMVAMHSDDKGLVIPPKLAEIQVVIIPIYNDSNKEKILKYAEELKSKMKDLRVYVDSSDAYSPGWKFNEYELKGIPIRLEIGQKEYEGRFATAKRRDTGEKFTFNVDESESKIKGTLDKIHENLYNKTKEFLESHIHKVYDYEKFKDLIGKDSGFVQAPWCGSTECEDKIAEETKAKATNMPFDAQHDLDGKKCIYCGKEAKYFVNFARSY